MRKLVFGLLATGLLASAGANAVPVTGFIQFGGGGTPTGSATWAASTGVDFTNPWLVVGGDGDYAGLFASQATFTDVSWGAGSGAVNVPLAQTIWEFTVAGTTYRMTVGTVDDIDRGDAANDNISVQGRGTLEIFGVINRDPTTGEWNFTGGFTESGAPNLSFSADAMQVPESGSLALLGLGLIGLGVARRRVAG